MAEWEEALKEALKVNPKAPLKGTAVLTLRIRKPAKILYDMLSDRRKRQLKRAVEAMILAFYKGKVNAEAEDDEGRPIIVNLNINEVKAEARAEARVDVKAEEVAEALRALREVAEFLRGMEGWVVRDQPLKPRVRQQLGRLARAEKLLQKLAPN